MESNSDAELIKNYLAGDESAFNELYCRYKLLLYSHLNLLLPGRNAEADDVFQQTWIKVIGKLGKYKEQGTFKAWLFMIARNLVIDRFRSVYFKAGVMVDIDDENFGELADDGGELPGESMDDERRTKLLEAALEKLNADQREVFLLRRQGFSFKEIAEMQNCPLNTALGRMQYAIKNLKQLIGETS